uniref:Uncharacterized protein n=1 Tax=Rhizophora mucronata TaxID=61149 RepID=A0A2P2Q150_RHIMU
MAIQEAFHPDRSHPNSNRRSESG